ncbi:MAG: WcbI family polysaccharide biosynthesis putative acetyltransferase [Rhodopila sp.]|nr:WcbI family polysaccharide biosynthesis putative acetyltransferase [Rhodopila sp.]
MPKLVIWGNCQTAGVWEVFRKLPAFAKDWEVRHHELWASGEKLASDLADLDNCDVLLVQDLRNWNSDPRRAALSPATRIIRFPFCYFAALWPFDGHQNGPDPGWHYGEGNLQFGFQDHLLGRLRQQEPEPERRLVVYQTLAVEDVPDIARYAAFEEARLLRDDSRLDFGIGRYIVDHYCTERLFHAITHPTPLLLARLVRELLDRLGLDDAGVDECTLDFFGYFQVPLHPLVIERLRITWADTDTRYNFQNREALTFEAYVRRYIQVYG